MSDSKNINISISHDDSVEIAQVLVLPKTPIMRPVMFSLIRQNVTAAGPDQHNSKGLDVGAENVPPVASDLVAGAAAIASESESGTTVAAQAAVHGSDTEVIRADKDMSSPVSSGAAAVQPPSETEEDTPSPVIGRLKGHHKPVLKTYPEIFGWTDPDDDFYIGSQPQEYPPTSAVRSLFKDKGKRKADPPVYIKSEEDDSKRIRLFD